MLILAIVFLLLTVLFGSVLLNAILKKKRTPKSITLLHGSAAFLSLLILISYIAAGHFDYILITSFVLFMLAALGGLTLLTLDIKGRPISKAIAIGHPLAALTAFALLIFYFLHRSAL